jgi:hypothetical protein
MALQDEINSYLRSTLSVLRNALNNYLVISTVPLILRRAKLNSPSSCSLSVFLQYSFILSRLSITCFLTMDEIY